MQRIWMAAAKEAEFVEIFIVFPQMFSVLPWRNDRRHTPINSLEDDCVCIIAPVCQKILLLQQKIGKRRMEEETGNGRGMML